eukprot:gene19150-29472_t
MSVGTPECGGVPWLEGEVLWADPQRTVFTPGRRRLFGALRGLLRRADADARASATDFGKLDSFLQSLLRVPAAPPRFCFVTGADPSEDTPASTYQAVARRILEAHPRAPFLTPENADHPSFRVPTCREPLVVVTDPSETARIQFSPAAGPPLFGLRWDARTLSFGTRQFAIDLTDVYVEQVDVTLPAVSGAGVPVQGFEFDFSRDSAGVPVDLLSEACAVRRFKPAPCTPSGQSTRYHVSSWVLQRVDGGAWVDVAGRLSGHLLEGGNRDCMLQGLAGLAVEDGYTGPVLGEASGLGGAVWHRRAHAAASHGSGRFSYGTPQSDGWYSIVASAEPEHSAHDVTTSRPVPPDPSGRPTANPPTRRDARAADCDPETCREAASRRSFPRERSGIPAVAKTAQPPQGAGGSESRETSPSDSACETEDSAQDAATSCSCPGDSSRTRSDRFAAAAQPPLDTGYNSPCQLRGCGVEAAGSTGASSCGKAGDPPTEMSSTARRGVDEADERSMGNRSSSIGAGGRGSHRFRFIPLEVSAQRLDRYREKACEIVSTMSRNSPTPPSFLFVTGCHGIPACFVPCLGRTGIPAVRLSVFSPVRHLYGVFLNLIQHQRNLPVLFPRLAPAFVDHATHGLADWSTLEPLVLQAFHSFASRITDEAACVLLALSDDLARQELGAAHLDFMRLPADGRPRETRSRKPANGGGPSPPPADAAGRLLLSVGEVQSEKAWRVDGRASVHPSFPGLSGWFCQEQKKPRRQPPPAAQQGGTPEHRRFSTFVPRPVPSAASSFRRTQPDRAPPAPADPAEPRPQPPAVAQQRGFVPCTALLPVSSPPPRAEFAACPGPSSADPADVARLSPCEVADRARVAVQMSLTCSFFLRVARVARQRGFAGPDVESDLVRWLGRSSGGSRRVAVPSSLREALVAQYDAEGLAGPWVDACGDFLADPEYALAGGHPAVFSSLLLGLQDTADLARRDTFFSVAPSCDDHLLLPESAASGDRHLPVAEAYRSYGLRTPALCATPALLEPVILPRHHRKAGLPVRSSTRLSDSFTYVARRCASAILTHVGAARVRLSFRVFSNVFYETAVLCHALKDDRRYLQVPPVLTSHDLALLNVHPFTIECAADGSISVLWVKEPFGFFDRPFPDGRRGAAMERLKALFPGEDAMIEDVLRVVSEHHRRKAAVRPVSFDQAASSEMTPEAVTAQVVGNLLLTANSNSTHTSGQAAHALSTRLKQAVLSFANVPSPSEAGVHFTDGGADANEFVLKSMLPVLPRRLGGGVARDVLLVGSIEHASLLDRAAELKSRGYVTHPIPIDTATGVYSVQYVREKLAEFGERVALVSMHHANNEIGAIQPLAEVGAAVRELTPKALFHADCIQTLGKIPIDLPAWRADAVTLSFHKVGGPKRTGAVVAAKANSLPAAFKATQDVASQIASWVAAAEAVGKLGE